MKYEYQFLTGYTNDQDSIEGFTLDLDRAGDDGWEAVGIIDDGFGHTTVLMKAERKRVEVPAEEEEP